MNPATIALAAGGLVLCGVCPPATPLVVVLFFGGRWLYFRQMRLEADDTRRGLSVARYMGTVEPGDASRARQRAASRRRAARR